MRLGFFLIAILFSIGATGAEPHVRASLNLSALESGSESPVVTLFEAQTTCKPETHVRHYRGRDGKIFNSNTVIFSKIDYLGHEVVKGPLDIDKTVSLHFPLEKLKRIRGLDATLTFGLFRAGGGSPNAPSQPIARRTIGVDKILAELDKAGKANVPFENEQGAKGNISLEIVN